ncbi:MAG: M48 family metallopeptidase, partial [Desulfovibrionaceae bacterium]
TFALDRLKGWLLTALLGGALLAALLWFLGRAGPLAWVWCWLAVSGFSLAMALLGPTLLLPLFNRFTPLEPGTLREGIEAMAARAGFRLSGIFVMDGSRRSTKGNAFFTGIGPTRRIALFDTLVDAQSTEETVGVLAHEIGHSRLGHIRKRLLTGVLKTGALLWLVSLFLQRPELQMALGMSEPSVHAGLLLFGVLFTPLSLPLSMLSAAVSRHHEFEADAFAARLTGRPGALASALAGLAARNKTNLTPHPLEVWLHHSHPPVLQRLARLERMEGLEGAGGTGPAGTSGPNGPEP